MDTFQRQQGIELPPQNPKPDLVKVLLRWKWLPILGMMVGATLGFLYHAQLPHKYKADAKIQVVSPNALVPISPSINQQMDLHSRADELEVVKSSAVINKAIEIGRLTEHRKLVGLSTEQIVKMIKKPKFLEVKPGSNDLNSDIIKISVTTDDAELSGDIVQAIVNGYEEFVTGNLKNYTKEAELALNKFSSKYEKSRKEAKTNLDKIQKNTSLLWKDGKPHDPLTDSVLAINEKLRALDGDSKNKEAILLQVEQGRAAKRPIEQLLRMVTSSMEDNGYKDDAGLRSHQELMRTMAKDIELFEQNQVIPRRTEVALLVEKSLGESHQTVMAAKNRLQSVETELAKQRARLKEHEVELMDSPTLEGRLNIACGAIQESLQKIAREKVEYLASVESMRAKLQENASVINNYSFSLAEFESLSEVATQIAENLRKLSLSADYGQKTVNKLDLSQLGAFDGPHWYLYMGIGGILGFMAFSGLAYLLELADSSYRNPDEISLDLGMPIIGHLPLATISRAERIDEKVDSSVVTLHKKRAPISEAFRGIRTALFFNCQQSGIKVIQVTSPIPGDGKSTIAANLAVSIAQSGRRVCIVDCDFRRPRVAKIFGLREDTGFVQVIGGKIALEEAIQQSSIENLSALTCGRRPANPSELLSSEVFGDLVLALRNEFDFVIIDTPPVLAVSDPANVASHVDGVLLTIRLRRNLRPIATRAAQMLHSVNAHMIGVVVNGIGVGGNSYGYGGYRYDNYSSSRGGGYGKSGYGGYGYGSTYQYGGYYGGTASGKDYYEDSIPKSIPKKVEVKT